MSWRQYVCNEVWFCEANVSLLNKEWINLQGVGNGNGERKGKRDYKSIKFHQSKEDIFFFFHLSSLSKTGSQTCRIFWKVVKVQGRAREFALLTGSQVVLMLLVWGLCFQNYGSKIIGHPVGPLTVYILGSVQSWHHLWIF